jgi:large subunit ribosomal protein L9
LEAKAEALAKRLSKVTLLFEAKAGETGHLYGSITTSSIADALEREVGEKFDRRRILCDPIREVGWHDVSVRLRADIVGVFKVAVKPEGGELPEEPTDEVEDVAAEAEGPAADAEVSGVVTAAEEPAEAG